MVALLVLVLVVHPQPPLLHPGTAAPAISLQSVDGRSVVAVGNAQHRTLVAVFIETACVTCQRQMPGVCAVAGRHPEALLVAVDAAGESRAALQAFAARNVAAGCRLVVLLDPGLHVSHAYEITVVPTVYVVNASGSITYAGLGAEGVDGIDAELQSMARGS